MSMYLGSTKVGYTIVGNEPEALVLPTSTSASATSGYTQKAAVTSGTTDKYINIGTGYNSAGAYYKISGDANLVSSNIVSGVSILGVSGSVVLQTVYTGSSAPSSTTGSDGDIYIQS